MHEFCANYVTMLALPLYFGATFEGAPIQRNHGADRHRGA